MKQFFSSINSGLLECKQSSHASGKWRICFTGFELVLHHLGKGIALSKLIVVISLCFVYVGIQAQGLTATQVYCDTADNYFDMLPNPDGSFYMVGRDSLQKSASLAAESDAIISKFRADYTLEWRKVIGGSKMDAFDQIHPYKNGTLLVIGHTESNDGDITYGYANTAPCPWAVIMDSMGNVLHANVWGYGNSTDIRNVMVTESGKIFLTGNTVANQGDFSINTGGFLTYQVFVIMTDSLLNKNWIKIIYSQTDALTYSSTILNDSLVCTISTFSNNGDYNVGTPIGQGDVFLFYIDTNQNIVRKQRLGGTKDEGVVGCINQGTSLLLCTSTNSKDGTFYVPEIPSTSTAPDWVCVSKLNPDGSNQWAHLFGPFGKNLKTPNTFDIRRMTLTPNRIWCYGALNSWDEGWIGPPAHFDTTKNGADAFLFQMDNNGILRAKLRLGHDYGEEFRFIRATSNNKIIAGLYTGTSSNVINPFSCYPSSNYKKSIKLYELTEWPTGIGDDELNDMPALWVYPNPAKEQVHIEIPSTGKKGIFYIYNSQGQLLKTIRTSKSKAQVDTASWAKGQYFIVADLDGRKYKNIFIIDN
jgi:hypothetical protein